MQVHFYVHQSTSVHEELQFWGYGRSAGGVEHLSFPSIHVNGKHDEFQGSAYTST